MDRASIFGQRQSRSKSRTRKPSSSAAVGAPMIATPVEAKIIEGILRAIYGSRIGDIREIRTQIFIFMNCQNYYNKLGYCGLLESRSSIENVTKFSQNFD